MNRSNVTGPSPSKQADRRKLFRTLSTRLFTGGTLWQAVQPGGNLPEFNAYVADEYAGLRIINVSNPANSQRVGGYDTPGSAYGVVLSGNRAYVADGEWGLMVFELGPAASPSPQITAIARGAGTATVYYTNTIPGTAYTLQYRTNLTTGTWQPVGT